MAKDNLKKKNGKLVFTEFDCPVCDANNPYDDGFTDGDEIRCFYCGTIFKVHTLEGSNRFKLIEV
ncbi:MAG: hypothetical protein GXP49_18100 [Deltaproteobacteria bacterium]|nr:hypothetical protein [Deltaproteobacteria bacterium]